MFFAAIAMVAGIFGYRRSGAQGNSPAFTGNKSNMGSYRPLHEVVSMSGAAPIPYRLLSRRSNSMFSQNKQRKYARQMGRKVA